jgi:hypothetical protein
MKTTVSVSLLTDCAAFGRIFDIVNGFLIDAVAYGI